LLTGIVGAKSGSSVASLHGASWKKAPAQAEALSGSPESGRPGDREAE